MLLSVFLLSCNKNKENAAKTAQNTEDQCFILNHGINFDEKKEVIKPPTHEEILKNLPTQIKMRELIKFEKFNYDWKTTEEWQSTEKKYFDSPEYQKKFADWISALPEFHYLSVNENYALAKNKYGLWIVEKNNADFKL